ncbi:hypothetical protein Ancab_020744 [Ancistrocladus abbreviatus]
MTDMISEDVQEQDLVPNAPEGCIDYDKPPVGDTDHKDEDEENPMPAEKEKVESIKKKYGGLQPKKPPLISKDHEHAFFDSADWALGKQGAAKAKGSLEALRPKLQPTPHQQLRSRLSPSAPGDKDVTSGVDSPAEDDSCSGENEKILAALSDNEIHHN